MNDDFLTKFRKPPRREFSAALYQRIAKPVKTTSRTRALRFAALAFSIFAVLTAVLFFSPSTRALADSIMRQFGGYIFVQGTPQPPTEMEIAEKQATAGAENRVKVSPEQQATLTAEKMQMHDQPQQKPSDAAGKPPVNIAQDAAAASQQTGFTVLAPSYVPAGYIPGDEKDISGGWEVSHQDGSVVVMTRFESQTDKSFFIVEELKYEQGQPRTVERPQIQDVTVRGQPGAWMPDEGGKSTLAWEENGITYLVVSNKLSLEESMKVAESLGK